MQPVVIGIAGGSGSGKSTLAKAVADVVPRPTSMLPFDNYYLDQQHLAARERERVNYDHPNSLDVDRFAADLALLRQGRQLAAPVYDFGAHTRSADVHVVEAAPVVVVDGILLFVFDEICALLDLKVFVDVSDDVRTARRLARDVAERGRTRDFSLRQIERTVRPMYGEFVQPSADRADVVIDGTADVDHSARLVVERLPGSVGVR